MMPNIDPRQLKNMMDRLGIKTSDVEATRVIIESNEGRIIIENPKVVRMEMQGVITFQINGSVSEEKEAIEASKEDIDFLKEKTGIDDEERIRKALLGSNGDIAGALLKLRGS